MYVLKQAAILAYKLLVKRLDIVMDIVLIPLTNGLFVHIKFYRQNLLYVLTILEINFNLE